jgi:hypothetical protein
MPDATIATGTEARVCADIAERQKRGISKYGATVEQNPLSMRQWLQHLYEEKLDACVYIKRIIEELDCSVLVYSLSDPRDGRVRYVGITNYGLSHRLHGHLTEARRAKSNSHRINWLRSLLASGVRPVIEMIESCPRLFWQERERYWIKTMRDAGHDLVNGSEGGYGRITWTAEMRAAMSVMKTGNSYCLGRTMPTETRAKIAAANGGRRLPDESYKRGAAKRVGIKQSDATKLKKRLAMLGKKLPPERIEQMRQSKLGVKLSLEARAKMSAARKGKPKSAQHKAAIKAALSAFHANKQSDKK